MNNEVKPNKQKKVFAFSILYYIERRGLKKIDLATELVSVA